MTPITPTLAAHRVLDIVTEAPETQVHRTFATSAARTCHGPCAQKHLKGAAGSCEQPFGHCRFQSPNKHVSGAQHSVPHCIISAFALITQAKESLQNN